MQNVVVRGGVQYIVTLRGTAGVHSMVLCPFEEESSRVAVPHSYSRRSHFLRVFVIAAATLAGCIGPIEQRVQTGGCSTNDPCAPEPVMVVGGHTFTRLAAGKYHTCGLTSTGEAWCWGANNAGQLGGTTPTGASGTPVLVPGQLNFASITAGEFHTCALAQDGAAYCWGSNASSALGTATVSGSCSGTPCSFTPVRAAGTLLFNALDAGATHTCGIDTSGLTQCWGANYFGEIGSDVFSSASTSPVTVPGGRTFTRISAGYRSTCALDAPGGLYCWGLGEDGQLGTLNLATCQTGLSAFRCSPAPVAANTPLFFNVVSTGAAFGCGISSGGVLLCWGLNGQGQLGNSGFVSSDHPDLVDIDGTWSAVTVGYFHACALRSGGAAFCWGLNSTAQLGDGSALYASTFPTPVAGGKTFVQIVAGANHTCALTADGVAWCWGGDANLQIGRG